MKKKLSNTYIWNSSVQAVKLKHIRHKSQLTITIVKKKPLRSKFVTTTWTLSPPSSLISRTKIEKKINKIYIWNLSVQTVKSKHRSPITSILIYGTFRWLSSIWKHISRRRQVPKINKHVSTTVGNRAVNTNSIRVNPMAVLEPIQSRVLIVAVVATTY